MKRKSLVGWTYDKWEEEFGYYDTATMVNNLKTIAIPEIYKNNKGNWTPESGKPRKVRITIEEINQLTTKKRGER